MENLSDRQAAEAVRSRIDWKYALGLQLSDPGFDFSALSEFRTRLLRGEAEERLLDRLLERLREDGFVKAKGTQRTDSTHVLAGVRELTRLELIGETMRAALNEIAHADPEWLGSIAFSTWHQFYDRRVEESRLPEAKRARAVRASHIGFDGFRLLDRIDTDRPDLSNRSAVQTLRQVWNEQFEPADAGELPDLRERRGRPSGGRIESPYDPEARYRNRRGTPWIGYIAHFTEACDSDLPRVVTHAHTTPADVHEAKCTGEIHRALTSKGLTPEIPLADSAYVDATHLSDAKANGFQLVGPTRQDPSWQKKTEGAFAGPGIEASPRHGFSTWLPRRL